MTGRRCPLCGCERYLVYLHGSNGELTSAALGSSRSDVSYGTILRCLNCRFGFAKNRPTEEELATLYRELHGEVYDAEQPGRNQTAARHLQIVQAHISSARLLDVGCSSGAFLRCASQAGWNCVGVEPSATAINKARTVVGANVQLVCATIEKARLQKSSFDVVTLWDVLEHVSEPVKFLHFCASLLKRGGYLFANVPDLDSFQARLFGRRWPLLLWEHLNYFNRSSLMMCGESAGLNPIRTGRRPVSFSVKYILYRLNQHRVPGAALGYHLLNRGWTKDLIVTVPLGEIFAVWQQ